MKDYTLNFNELKMFILNYEIKNDEIIINYADELKSIIPYSLENEEKILKKMKEQVINAVASKNKIKSKINTSYNLSILYLLLIVFNLLILNEGISESISLSVILTIYSSIMAIVNITSLITNSIKKKDIDKHFEFLNHEDNINQYIKENKDILVNVNNKTKEILKPIIKEKHKVNLNDIDKVDYNDLTKIINDIKYINDSNINDSKNSKVLIKK